MADDFSPCGHFKLLFIIRRYPTITEVRSPAGKREEPEFSDKCGQRRWPRCEHEEERMCAEDVKGYN